MTYSDADQNWSWSDSNYMLAPLASTIFSTKNSRPVWPEDGRDEKRVIVREEIRSAG